METDLYKFLMNQIDNVIITTEFEIDNTLEIVKENKKELNNVIKILTLEREVKYQSSLLLIADLKIEIVDPKKEINHVNKSIEFTFNACVFSLTMCLIALTFSFTLLI